jgi:hypothetical protein
MWGKPLSAAAATLQEGLPTMMPHKSIPTKNRFNVFRDRSLSAVSASLSVVSLAVAVNLWGKGDWRVGSSDLQQILQNQVASCGGNLI